MTSDVAAALTRALSCGVWPREGRVSVYVSYTDESQSKDQKSGMFFIAGYVADELKWPEFSKRWSEEVILSDPPIPYLHMVEIRSESWRVKHGLTRVQADEKIRIAVDLIAQTDFITAYCAHISERAYNKLLGVIKDEDPVMATKSHIDYLCFGGYSVNLLKKLAAEHSDLRKVVFNISRKKGVSHHLEHSLYDATKEMLEQRHPKFAPMFGNVLALDMDDHMPLQAADVFCWHLQRSFSMSGPEDPDTMRHIITILNRGFCNVALPDFAVEEVTKSYLEFKRREDQENEK
jgi:hypothetical protein